MSWAYRCKRCRGRNTLKHKYEWYKRAPKCKHCSHSEFIPPPGSDKKPVIGPVFYLDKARQYRTDFCVCEGYHFTHRVKSPYCIHNPEYEVRVRCGRYGELEADVRADIARREKEESIELEKNNTAQADAIRQHSEAA